MLSGCSATAIVYFENVNKLYISHLGDTKAFIFKKSNFVSKNKKHYT